MEAAICNSSSEKIQHEPASLSIEKEGIKTPKSSLPVNNQKMDVNYEEKKIKVNGHVSDDLGKADGFLSQDVSGCLTQKSFSPTLIESAFKVMKNLFSPEKPKNKSSDTQNPVSHHGSASGSLSSSVYIPNKTGFCTSESELKGNIQSAENFFKGDNLNTNHLGLLHSSQDTHNSTGDSFLTTVSLIDDSFHSAVTHLDENGEVLGGGKFTDSVLNDSQNLDLLDSYNNTLENSGYILDNTMFKNYSFTPNRTKLGNFSCESKEGKLEGSDNTQIVDSCFENSRKVAKYQDDILKENDINMSNQLEKNVDGKLNQFSPNNHIIKNAVSEGSQEVRNELDDKTINNYVSKSNKKTKMEDLFVNKSFEKQTNIINSKETEALKLKENPSSTLQSQSVEEKSNVKKKEEIKAVGESEAEAWSDIRENVVGSSISTTTIVLNAVDSVDLDNMLMSLKADDSETNTSSLTSFEGSEEIRSVSLENVVEKQVEISPKMCDLPEGCSKQELSDSNSDSEKNIYLFAKQKGKKLSKSEGNSPNKSANTSRNKLNKSVDFIRQKSMIKSPKDKTNLQERSRLQSPVTISLVKNSEISDKVTDMNNSINDSKLNVTPEIETILSPITFSIGDTVNQNFEKTSQLDFGKSEVGLSTEESDAVFVSSQQSYTILISPDNNLNRPIINSTNSDQDLPQECVPIKNDVPNPTFSKEKEITGTVIKLPNDYSDISSETVCLDGAPKHSTPLCEKNSLSKSIKLSQSESTETFVKPTSLNSQSPEVNSEVKMETQNDIEGCNSYSKPDLLGKAMQIFSSNQESDLSPMIPVTSSHCYFQFPSKSPKEINQNSNKKSKSPTPNKKHQTHEKNSTSSVSNKSNQTLAETEKLNQTFEKSSEVLLQTKINKAFEKGLESPTKHELNQTFDKKVESINVMNVTYESDSEPLSSDCLNQEGEENKTFKLKNAASHMSNNKELNKTFDKKTNIEDSLVGSNIESTQMMNLIKSEESSSNLELPVDLGSINDKIGEITELGTCKDDLNESFISTTSSNASLISNATVLLNHGPIVGNKVINDLAGKFEKIHFNDSIKKETKTKECSDDINSMPTDMKIGEGPQQAEFLEDNLSCDADLAQLIQEQFSCTDIEKICNVVEDMSSMKLSNQILKASEQFEKSFHENMNKSEKKHNPKEVNLGKSTGILTPQSLDFLSSIGGKPTGRDLSRESLYVKFDPLVQAPVANSLIDFTKEVEALATVEASPEADSSVNICEQLLTISPQRKPDDIVPPLTPISHKSKTSLKEDKNEKLKELQNEIYFLKNLYAEREKLNKAKMEDYESQIAKLTGQICILEDKLKDSNEREKSLVKKLKEQTQSISQFKVIMDEYVTVISRLTSELETLKNENVKQIEALTSEKDSYVTHLQNTEAAFTDVHVKYEKSKKTIVNLKANEVMYRNTITDQMHKLEDFKKKAKEAQEKAYKEFQMIQEELNETKANHTQETARLRAQLRKTELKLEAMQDSLDQKIKENQQLTAICDELIEGKK